MEQAIPDTDLEAIIKAINANGWQRRNNPKAAKYVGQFFERHLIGRKVVAKVVGNYGTYTVSFDAKSGSLTYTCSCYVGGGCHHSLALVETFVRMPDSFVAVVPKQRKTVRTLDDLTSYLKTTTLDSLTERLKEKGISQSALAQSMGMNPRHLTSIKSCEARGRFYNELGATKLAALWVLENIKQPTAKAVKKAAAKKAVKKKKH